jgi:hypothetical protein
MTTSPRRRLGATGVLLLAVLAVAPAAAATKTTPRLGSHTMINPTMDRAPVNGLFKASRDAHLGTVRLDVLVSSIFPQSPDQPDWTSLDIVREAARYHHLQVMAVLSGTPWWDAQCPLRALRSDRCPPRDDAQWGRMVEQIAARAPEIGFWEILNEANIVNRTGTMGEYFYGDTVAYARLLRVTAAAIRRGNPRAKLVFTGVNAPYDRWLEKVLARPGVVRAFDIANLHVRGGVGKLDDMVRVARARYRAHGFRGPLWVTEMGYPSDRHFQWDPVYIGRNQRAAQHEQARYLRKAVSVLLKAGAKRVFITLRDYDYGWGSFASEGVMSWPALTVKQAYFTVRSMGYRLIRRAARARALRDSARAHARHRRELARRLGRSRRAFAAAR